MRRIWLNRQITPLRLFLGVVLVCIVVGTVAAGTWWTLQGAHASGSDAEGLPRIKSATSIFGTATGKNAGRIRPGAVIPGRQLPGLAGHAAQRAGRNIISA